MQRKYWVLLPWLSIGCANIDAAEKRDGADGASDTGPNDGDSINPLPDFVNDCDTEENDTFETLSGIESDIDGISYNDVDLCQGDQDYYRVDVAPGAWVSVAIAINGSGNNGSDPTATGTDLDLWEIEDPQAPIDPQMDFVETDTESPNVIWYSASEENYERLAWANTSDTTQHHYLVVDGFDGANTTYDIRIRTSDWHDTEDCDDVLEADEDGPCTASCSSHKPPPQTTGTSSPIGPTTPICAEKSPTWSATPQPKYKPLFPAPHPWR